MGINIHRFEASDLVWIVAQPAQRDDWQGESARLERARIYEQCEHAWTIRDGDGDILICIGLIANHAQCMTAWSLLSKSAGRHMLAITRWARRYLDGLDVRRFDMMVRAGFTEGCRWACLLGFEREGVQHGWYPDGEDMIVFALVKGVA